MMTSSRHKPEIACVAKSSTLRHWRHTIDFSR